MESNAVIRENVRKEIIEILSRDDRRSANWFTADHIALIFTAPKYADTVPGKYFAQATDGEFRMFHREWNQFRVSGRVSKPRGSK